MVLQTQLSQALELSENNVYIKQAPIKKIDELFLYLYYTVGLRGSNFPNQIECTFLYQFIQEEYGNHTIDEIKLAFKKAIKGDFKDIDANPYENFSNRYFATIMNAYREWASEHANKILQEKESKKLIEQYQTQMSENIEWRAVIESDYQNFLKGISNWTTWPEAHYLTLEQDESFPKNSWEKKLIAVKNMILQDLNKQIATMQLAIQNKDEGENISQRNYGDKFNHYQKLLREIDEYKTGAKDKELEIICKQKVVLIFFNYNKKMGLQNIYTFPESSSSI